jgi:ABC-2 type transport system ATP-binding protein
METIIAENLTKDFGSKRAVDDVSFKINKGEIFGFLGPNGSGKSTVIRMLCGLLRPTSGRGFIEGINTVTQGEEVRRSIGYMSQKFGLYPDLTVRQNMEFYGQVYGVNGNKLEQRIKELCDKTNLGPYLEFKSENLSGGWKQRLALSCSLLHNPSVLFLDEPTAGIDPVARREVWDLLFDLSTEGMTMLVTTHYMDEAERCHRVAYIYLSKLIAEGSIDSLINMKGLFAENTQNVIVEGNPTMELYAHLKGLNFISNVTLFGKAIHCVIPKDIALHSFKEQLQLAINSDNISIRESKPSLEDVFVNLTKRESEVYKK